MRFLPIILFGFIFFNLHAETQKSSSPQQEMVQQYLEIYTSFQDFERLRPFYTKDTIMEDVPSKMKVVGGDKIISELSVFFESWKVKVHDRRQLSFYISNNGWVVSNNLISFSIGNANKPDEPLVYLTAPGLTLLQVRDGKVVHHLDFPDYPALEPQLVRQKSPLANPNEVWLPPWEQIEAYLAAYMRFSNFSALQPFYCEKTLFEDPAWGKRFVGEQVVPGLEKAAAGYELQTNHIHYLSRFRTRGGQVVLNILFSGILKTEGKRVPLTIPMVIVLEFDKDGKVLVHRDFPDYNAMKIQLATSIDQ